MSDQHKTLGFGTEEEYCYNSNYGIESQLICCPSPGTLSWEAQCWSEIPTGHADIPSNNLPARNWTHGENVEIIHDTFMGNTNGKAAQVVSKKLFCFADGHEFDPQRVDLFYLDLSKRAYQVTIHRHNGFHSFTSTKVVDDVSDLFPSLKVFLLSKVRLMFLIDEEYSLLTDELNLIGSGQLHLQMELELAFSLQNLMRSTMRYAISQASSSRKTNSQNVRTFVVCECECENELFLGQAADCRGNSSQSVQSFIPRGNNLKISPCRVASVVYSLYLYGDVQEDFTILGRVFDINSSVCSSSVKFSYRTERHSLPGHSEDYHIHGNLFLNLLVPSEESPVGFFEIVYCPQRAHLTSKGQRSPGINKQKEYALSPYLESAVVQSSSNGRQMLLEAFKDDAIASHESQEVIVDNQTNIQNKRKKSRSIWTAAELISLEDLKQNYGKKREEAAESLRVSVSTFKRICRKFGIPRWPLAKRKKDECLISVRRCDAPIAEVRTSQLPQNSMPCEDRETTSVSRQKRRKKEIEADNVDVNNHFEEQPFEIQNCTSKRQAVDCATKDSSCLNSISGTNEGVYESQSSKSKSINGNVVDHMDSTRMGVQPFLESISIQHLNSISFKENTTHNTKLIFDNLIALPLKDLINSEKETSMKETLCILVENLSLFSVEQAKQIIELKFDFPTLLHSWREYSQSQVCNQRFFADLEKNRTLLETSAKDEESLKIRYDELQIKKKELMAQLEAVQKEQVGIAEQRCEKFKQTKHLVSLAEEKAGRTKEKHLVMTITSAKLNNLVDKWAAIQSLFM